MNLLQRHIGKSHFLSIREAALNDRARTAKERSPSKQFDFLYFGIAEYTNNTSIMFLDGDNDAEIAEVELLEAVVVLRDWHEKA